MDHFEMTEKLRERARVSYEEAKEALEFNDWDMLEAIVYLEREGKTSNSGQQHDSTRNEPEAKPKEKKQRVSGNLFETAAKALGLLIEKGNRNRLEIYREGKVLTKIPLTIAAILTLCMFWIVVPVLLIGWLAGCSYRLAGSDIDKAENAGEVI